MKKLITPVLSLFIICVVVSGLLALTNDVTKDKIAEQEKAALNASMKSVLPDAEEFTATDNPDVYKGTKGSDVVGYAINVKTKGYGGTISVLVGIKSDGVIAGATILSHSETPGMGAKTADEKFISQFSGKTSSKPLALGTDIDAVTGATVSSRAVTGAVNTACDIYNEIIGKESEEK